MKAMTFFLGINVVAQKHGIQDMDFMSAMHLIEEDAAEEGKTLEQYLIDVLNRAYMECEAWVEDIDVYTTCEPYGELTKYILAWF